MTKLECQTYLAGTKTQPESALKRVMAEEHPNINMTKLRIHMYKCKILYKVTVEYDGNKKELLDTIPYGNLYDVYKRILEACEIYI